MQSGCKLPQMWIVCLRAVSAHSAHGALENTAAVDDFLKFVQYNFHFVFQ